MIRNSKKGFSLVEAVFTLAVLGIATYFAALLTIGRKYDLQINNDVNMLVKIIDAGVMNAQTGYGKGTGGYCSANVGLYEDISAIRIFKCAEMLTQSVAIDASAAVDDTTERDGRKSFFRFMVDYSDSANEGCRAYFNEAVDMDKFQILLNCSHLQNSTQKRRMESEFMAGITKAFPFAVADFKNLATDFNTSVGGTADDGVILFTIRN